MPHISITDYNPSHQPYFEQFNRNWIEKYFWLKEIDLFVLQHPEEAILGSGGAILMAHSDNLVAGTVALKKISDTVFEFTKMAVDEKFRRQGIAEALSLAAFEKSRQLGATKVILYSHSSLIPAITLYKKLGFTQVPIDSDLYKRSDIKMEIGV